MHYPIHHFTITDQNLLRDLVKLFPLACIISAVEDEIITSHIPLYLKDGKMVGHVDANNPHVEFLKNGRKVKLVFSGPDAYISPSHFSTNELPTYNSIRIEANAKVYAIEDDLLKAEIQTLTEQMEGENGAYKLTEKEARLHSLMPYIHGFQLEVEEFVGRVKMSQDKKQSHFEKAKKLVLESYTERMHEALQLIQKKQS